VSAPNTVEELEGWLDDRVREARDRAWKASLLDDADGESSWLAAANAYQHVRDNTLYISSLGFDYYWTERHCHGCDDDFCDGAGV
jgi:hypothetical protein